MENHEFYFGHDELKMSEEHFVRTKLKSVYITVILNMLRLDIFSVTHRNDGWIHRELMASLRRDMG